MKVTLYKPTLSASQSSCLTNKFWYIRYNFSDQEKSNKALVDKYKQIKLKFSSLDAAKNFCHKNNYIYDIDDDSLNQTRNFIIKSYSNNFK